MHRLNSIRRIAINSKHYGFISWLNANGVIFRNVIELRSDKLKEGMYLEVSIPGEGKQNAYEVNRRLLVDETNLYVVTNSTLQLVPITVLHKNQNTVIVSDLTDGIQLLSEIIPGSYKGMKVSINSEN